MARHTKRMLTDEQWERIAAYFPQHPPSPKGGRPRVDDRECLEGILWLIRTGCRWQDIPVDLPSGSTCWRRLRDWASEEILPKIHDILIEELDDLGEIDFEELFADATFIRAKKGVPRLAKPRLARV
jgi:transposase